MCVGVVSVMISAIVDSVVLEYIGYVLSMIALVFYFYQIYIIYITRVRLDNDIYLHSLLFSYGSLIGRLKLVNDVNLRNDRDCLIEITTLLRHSHVDCDR